MVAEDVGNLWERSDESSAISLQDGGNGKLALSEYRASTVLLRPLLSGVTNE